MKGQRAAGAIRAQSQQVKRARRREISGLHPAGKPVTSVRPHLNLLHHAGVAAGLFVLARLDAAGARWPEWTTWQSAMVDRPGSS